MKIYENIEDEINSALGNLRALRDSLMSLPDEESGRPHSHGETDNSRGLRIRAVSLAITHLEIAGKFYSDSKNEKLGEYYVKP